jgi:hypothetical protein
LFDLFGDGLSEMLNGARNAGYVKGLASNLVMGGLSHLHYADDTIILTENDEGSIDAIKFIMYCYEAISGLKINY